MTTKSLIGERLKSPMSHKQEKIVQSNLEILVVPTFKSHEEDEFDF